MLRTIESPRLPETFFFLLPEASENILSGKYLWRSGRVGQGTNPLQQQGANSRGRIGIRRRATMPIADLGPDLLLLVLRASGLHSMHSAIPVCRGWEAISEDRALWAEFCDELWPGVRAATGTRDCKGLCRRLLESSRPPLSTDPSDVVVIVECRGVFEEPLVCPISSLKKVYRETGEVREYLIPTTKSVGTEVQLKFFEEYSDRFSIRLLRRRDGKIACLKGPERFSCSEPLRDSRGQAWTGGREYMYARHWCIPSEPNLREQGVFANANNQEFVAFAVQLLIFRDYFESETLCDEVSPNFLHLKLIQFSCAGASMYSVAAAAVGEKRLLGGAELDRNFLDKLCWE